MQSVCDRERTMHVLFAKSDESVPALGGLYEGQERDPNREEVLGKIAEFRRPALLGARLLRRSP